MAKVVMIDIPKEKSREDLFCGYIEGKLRFKGGDPRLSRCHSQPKRIHSALGVAPTISAGETLGRYWTLVTYGETIKF